MNKIITIFLLLVSFNIFAYEKLVCPDGAKEVTGERKYKGKKTIAHGCVNKKGELHGISLIIYNNIVIDKCNYKNGLQHGKCNSWYFTGEKKASHNFESGKPHGKSTLWYKNGTIELQVTHKNGKLVNISQ